MTIEEDYKIRCSECKTTIDEPEDCNGVTPTPLEVIKCPSCGHTTARMFWVELVNDEKENQGHASNK